MERLKRFRTKRVIRSAVILAVLAVMILTLSGFTGNPSSTVSAPACGQSGGKNCSISKWMPQGTSLVIANATTGVILYRISNQYPTLFVNGVAYDGRYHRFAIGSSIYITRPLFSTGFGVSVSCAYGISDAE